MTDNTITMEVNGVEVTARPGQMIIEVTDAADVYVPRFCYHDKLSVAANCRMCLVDVEKAPKPLPACATPVADGMKVFTKSRRAIDAQKAVMEFLLINHPLDCPICDQGGECELQDIAMGFGRGISRYTERKRVVQDKDLGPLVSTDMTRCIHCTRCVRFGQEIAGIQELGTIGRGEHTEIRAFLEHGVDHELSGNIIDLCPVGALNNKPYRFAARAWEMVSRRTIAPHDCFGSHVDTHVLNGRIKRIVPAINEAINETWLSDRDRYGFEGVNGDDRLLEPVVRDDGEWRECSWDEALDVVTAGLTRLSDDVGAWVSPSATLEEGYLLSRIVRQLGSESIDYRLRQRDFRQQDQEPRFPWLGLDIADIDHLDAAIAIGAEVRAEVPLLAHRLRKAALGGARISFVNPVAHPVLFPLSHEFVDDDLCGSLARIVAAAAEGTQPVSSVVADLIPRDFDERSAAAARSLIEAKSGAVFLGHLAVRHPRYAELRMLAIELARLTGVRFGVVSEGANAAGLSLAGVLPHRRPDATAVNRPGRTIADMLRQPPRGLILHGIEPESDIMGAFDPMAAVSQADFVVGLSPYFSSDLSRGADVILPVGAFGETSGTFVNGAGQWQSFAAVARSPGASRPGWKVLRVLGNLLGVADCDYASSEDVRDAVRAACGDTAPEVSVLPDVAPGAAPPAGELALSVPIYSVDALVRRSAPLQATPIARRSQLAGSAAQKIA